MLAKYADEPDFIKLPCVKHLMCGAATIPTSQEENIQRLMPNVDCLIQAYGMTELMIITNSCPPYYKKGSVGVLFSDVEVQVLSIISDERLGANQPGELLIKSPSLCRKYRCPESVREFLHVFFCATFV